MALRRAQGVVVSGGEERLETPHLPQGGRDRCRDDHERDEAGETPVGQGEVGDQDDGQRDHAAAGKREHEREGERDRGSRGQGAHGDGGGAARGQRQRHRQRHDHEQGEDVPIPDRAVEARVGVGVRHRLGQHFSGERVATDGDRDGEEAIPGDAQLATAGRGQTQHGADGEVERRVVERDPATGRGRTTRAPRARPRACRGRARRARPR